MNKQQYQYDLVVYIGRFQPFHNGHLETIKTAARYAPHVLALVGSANSPRTIRNPWTFEERAKAIRESKVILNLHIDGITDYSYNNNKWIQQVGEKVEEVKNKIWASREFQASRGTTDADNSTPKEDIKIAVIGHDKDFTSNYLNFFPQWDFIEMTAYPAENDRIDSTKIRQLMFNKQVSFTDSVIPGQAYGNQVRKLINSDEFDALQAEWDYIQNYRKSWEHVPYPVNFTTVDAVVVQSGHVLLVQRGAQPGKGQWAMPGGFVNNDEKLQDAVVRELREETRLKVPEKVLRGSITHKDVFDDPERSVRGRTISYTYMFELDPTADLPKVKGSDDAAEAKWVPLAEFEKMQPVMFEDHFSIIMNMLSRA